MLSEVKKKKLYRERDASERLGYTYTGSGFWKNCPNKLKKGSNPFVLLTVIACIPGINQEDIKNIKNKKDIITSAFRHNLILVDTNKEDTDTLDLYLSAKGRQLLIKSGCNGEEIAAYRPR